MLYKDTLSAQLQEMRRGTIVLALLSQLDTPRYGYDLLQKLESQAFVVDAGTLYPLLRRLEKQGVLESTWDTSEARPRKYYALSGEGKMFYVTLLKEWQQMTDAINIMSKEK